MLYGRDKRIDISLTFNKSKSIMKIPQISAEDFNHLWVKWTVGKLLAIFSAFLLGFCIQHNNFVYVDLVEEMNNPLYVWIAVFFVGFATLMKYKTDDPSTETIGFLVYILATIFFGLMYYNSIDQLYDMDGKLYGVTKFQENLLNLEPNVLLVLVPVSLFMGLHFQAIGKKVNQNPNPSS